MLEWDWRGIGWPSNAFGAETGPYDVGVALGGCVAGAAEGVYAGVTDTVVTTVGGAGVGATLGAINAKHDYEARMQACATIP